MEQATAVDTKPRKYANVLRPLLSDELARLRSSLQRHGLMNDLVRDQYGDLLDGHHREDLCRELGIKLRYQTITTDNPVSWIKGFQQARRNLSREEMRALVAEQLVAAPHSTDQTIAKITGAGAGTVGIVRAKLAAKGKIDANVVRLESNGRPARGARPKSNLRIVDKNSPERPKHPVPEPEVSSHIRKDGPKLERKGDKVHGLSECILYYFTDDDAFHSIPKMRKHIDPDDAFGLTTKSFQKCIFGLEKGKTLYVETRPAAHDERHYRFYRQGTKIIGLAVLEFKFRPVIEYLKEEGQRPISHQSTVRFNHAAAMLTQLLRDLEAE